MAFEIGILPNDFWRMTFREFMDCVEGYRRRDAHDRRKRAWEVAHLLSPWSKRRITVAMLLGEEDDNAPQSAEEFHLLMCERLRVVQERQAAKAAAAADKARGGGHGRRD